MNPIPIILCASMAMAAVSMKKLGKRSRVVKKKTYKEALMTGL
jgi:hypothetical protein